MTLTRTDIKEIRQIVQEEVQEEVREIKEQINHLPTKDEFYEKMDEVITAFKNTPQFIAETN